MKIETQRQIKYLVEAIIYLLIAVMSTFAFVGAYNDMLLYTYIIQNQQSMYLNMFGLFSSLTLSGIMFYAYFNSLIELEKERKAEELGKVFDETVRKMKVNNRRLK